MLDTLRINGFRTFKEYAVEDLGRVNLFVGRNNSGKTTILEAAEMLLAADSAAALVGSAMRRGEMHVQREKDRPDRYVDVSHLFCGHICDIGASFRISGAESDGHLEMACEVYPAEGARDAGGELFSELDIGEPSLSLSIRHSRGEKPVTFPLVLSGAVSLDVVRRQSLRPSPEERPVSVSFVRSEALDSVELQEFWDSIALTEEEPNVIESLRILEPRIDRIAFLGSRSYYRYGASSGGIYIKLRDLDDRIPLGSLGDGIRHLLTLSLAVSRSRHGVVMVDEIDTGLHHSVMSDMWRVLISTAERLDVQVFATTHSLDCVRSLAWLANTQPDLCRGTRMHRVDSERPRTVVYSPDEISTAAAQHVELRG